MCFSGSIWVPVTEERPESQLLCFPLPDDPFATCILISILITNAIPAIAIHGSLPIASTLLNPDPLG